MTVKRQNEVLLNCIIFFVTLPAQRTFGDRPYYPPVAQLVRAQLL